VPQVVDSWFVFFSLVIFPLVQGQVGAPMHRGTAVNITLYSILCNALERSHQSETPVFCLIAVSDDSPTPLPVWQTNQPAICTWRVSQCAVSSLVGLSLLACIGRAH
jgi:hypothetical protein